MSRYPYALRVRIVALILDGRPVSELERDLRIPHQTLYRWLAEFGYDAPGRVLG